MTISMVAFSAFSSGRKPLLQSFQVILLWSSWLTSAVFNFCKSGFGVIRNSIERKRKMPWSSLSTPFYAKCAVTHWTPLSKYKKKLNTDCFLSHKVSRHFQYFGECTRFKKRSKIRALRTSSAQWIVWPFPGWFGAPLSHWQLHRCKLRLSWHSNTLLILPSRVRSRIPRLKVADWTDSKVPNNACFGAVTCWNRIIVKTPIQLRVNILIHERGIMSLFLCVIQ